jgi:hypothetical protein
MRLGLLGFNWYGGTVELAIGTNSNRIKAFLFYHVLEVTRTM